MNIGKTIRLNRLFAHPSKRFCSVAVDHFLMYGLGLPSGLNHMKQTLAEIAKASPDAVTMHKGIAKHLWFDYAGKIPLIVNSTFLHPDSLISQQTVTAEEAIRLGADAIAIVIYVSGPGEVEYLRTVTDLVREANLFELPVICHIYPRKITEKGLEISFKPEDIAWAAHCAGEVGVDIIKVPYCGDVSAYRDIVSNAPVPVVAAGGPQQTTLEAALDMMAQVVQSGANGATIGRNIWGQKNITTTVQAFKAVIHDGLSAKEAIKLTQ